MSKYNLLWEYIKNKNENIIIISFDEIESILSFPIDHSFLNCKNESNDYGYTVKKISMKDKKVCFEKI